MLLTIDVLGWTQEEKNYLQAAAVVLLFEAGITYDDIRVKDGVINILNPASDPTDILSPDKLKACIDAELEKSRIATAEALLEVQARERELAESEFSDIRLIQIDARVDAIENLAQLKVLLKRFVRYVIART